METRWPDGLISIGLRADNKQNQLEAFQEGYLRGREGVWDALVEHELGHTLIARALWQSESPTLRHEAGGEDCRYALRLYEEALVVSFQFYSNTNLIDPVWGGQAEWFLPSLKAKLDELRGKLES